MTDATALAKQIIHEVNLGECWEDQEHLGEIAIVERILTLALAQARRDSRKELLIEISQRYAAGSTGFDILTWCYSELDKCVATAKEAP